MTKIIIGEVEFEVYQSVDDMFVDDFDVLMEAYKRIINSEQDFPIKDDTPIEEQFKSAVEKLFSSGIMTGEGVRRLCSCLITHSDRGKWNFNSKLAYFCKNGQRKHTKELVNFFLETLLPQLIQNIR